tara:strand:+ start:88 stop:288 length:201 start_codon:yes stop_codon:yes gene_type:complete
MPNKRTRRLKSRLRSKSKKLFKMVQVPVLNLMKKIEQNTSKVAKVKKSSKTSSRKKKKRRKKKVGG